MGNQVLYPRGRDDPEFEAMKQTLVTFPTFAATANQDKRDMYQFPRDPTGCIVTGPGISCWERVTKGWKETLNAVS
jgi:hypothetical protein